MPRRRRTPLTYAALLERVAHAAIAYHDARRAPMNYQLETGCERVNRLNALWDALTRAITALRQHKAS